jgi:cobalt-precorrin 5A hydrolase
MSTENKTAVICVTQKGYELASMITAELRSDLYVPTKLDTTDGYKYDSISECFEKLFNTYTNIVAVMAQGIVTRMIAPHIKSKYTDPAIVTCDEVGRFAISTLSGHEGGRKCAGASGLLYHRSTTCNYYSYRGKQISHNRHRMP